MRSTSPRGDLIRFTAGQIQPQTKRHFSFISGTFKPSASKSPEFMAQALSSILSSKPPKAARACSKLGRTEIRFSAPPVLSGSFPKATISSQYGGLDQLTNEEPESIFLYGQKAQPTSFFSTTFTK